MTFFISFCPEQGELSLLMLSDKKINSNNNYKLLFINKTILTQNSVPPKMMQKRFYGEFFLPLSENNIQQFIKIKIQFKI